jgi:hypothetical protein
MTSRERNDILNQIDFRFYYTLANVARLLQSFHQVFALAQDPNSSLEIDSFIQRGPHQEAIISLANPDERFFKIRCPQWSHPATEQVRPAVLLQEKSIQQAYLYLATIWQRLLPLRSSFDKLSSMPTDQWRILQLDLKKIVAIWPGFEKSLWPMPNFVENFAKASPARQKSVDQFLTELNNLERHVQNIIAAQCAAQLTTPARILEAY